MYVFYLLLLWLQRVPLGICTPLHESAPVVTAEGKTLFFWRMDDPQGFGAQDIFYAVWDDSLQDFKEVRNMGSAINDPRGNIPFGVSPDGHKLLVYKEFKNPHNPCPLGIASQVFPGMWSAPRQLRIEGFSSEIQASITASWGADGKTLLLSLRDAGSRGEDLFVSFYDDEQKIWTRPKPLGALNTSADEITPFLAADGVTLYYSSNKPGGIGGFDVYMTRRLDDSWEKWSPPVNLKEINTPTDDYYFKFAYFMPSVGYMVSTDSLSTQGRQIYKVVVPPAYQPRPVVVVEGKVLDRDGRTPVGQVELRYYELPSEELVGISYSHPQDGSYKIILPLGQRYAIIAQSSENYYAISEYLDLSGYKKFAQLTKDLWVARLRVGQVVRLNNLFFAVGDSTLSPDSQMELRRLVLFLRSRPSVNIEIIGHTDSTGLPQKNEILSWARARAVERFLVEQGIEPQRVKVRGAASREPIAPNYTPEGRAQNRRVEFRVETL